jgi:hypothetical protein
MDKAKSRKYLQREQSQTTLSSHVRPTKCYKNHLRYLWSEICLEIKLFFVITLSVLLISSNHSKLIPTGSYVRPKYKVWPEWVSTQRVTSQISYNPLSDTGISVVTHPVHSSDSHYGLYQGPRESDTARGERHTQQC